MQLLNLFVSFIKIGAFSFGGGYAMIPLFEREIVFHHWTAAADYTKMIAVAQLIPGPFAIDSAAYIGYKVSGFPGALIASVALAIPSFIILLLITHYYIQFKNNNEMKSALESVRPAVIALLIGAAYIIGVQPMMTIWRSFSWQSGSALFLMVAGILLLQKTKINPVLFIILFGAAGLVLF